MFLKRVIICFITILHNFQFSNQSIQSTKSKYKKLKTRNQLETHQFALE